MDPQAPATQAHDAATPAAPTLVPFGKYLLLERVAVGGMAEVWLAKRMDPKQGGVSELLAVKRILPNLSVDDDFIKMFVDEARIAGQLQHPGIVPMHELGRIGQTFYIAMEYVWGRDLLQILRTIKASGDKLSFAGVAYVAARVCEALHYAHVKVDKHGKPLELVHRDVSPQNVLLSFDGKVKLIDFGIAKATSRTTKTQAGTLKGKVGYMSPEQVRGQPIDGRSDLFAVGTLLYEMLTVRPLFARGNNFEAMNRVRDADVPPIESRVPEIPPALAQIVMKALSREPSDRYTDAQDMQRALTVFIADNTSSFERYDLATWLRRVYEGEFAREKARLDALDSIGRPAISPVAKRHSNPVTSLEIATTSLFDESEEGEGDATQIGEQVPYQPIKVVDAASEVFFHRDEVVQVGERNPEGNAARPLKALFRPGQAAAVEAYRPPIVGRDDSPAGPRAGAAAPVVAAPAVAAPAVTAPAVARPVGAPSPLPRASIPPPRASVRPPPSVSRRSTLAPGDSAVPPPAEGAPRPPAMKLPRAEPLPTLPFGIDVMSARSTLVDLPRLDEELARATQPHHAPASSRPPGAGPSSEMLELSGSFLQASSVEVASELGAVVVSTPPRRRAEEDDDAFEDGGIRQPLVRPVVSRARIVAVSDQPPRPPVPPVSAPLAASKVATAPRAPQPPIPAAALPPPPAAQPPLSQPGTVPLVGAGDTPSTSAITRALEEMAAQQNKSRTSSSGQIEAPSIDPGRLSGFALDPQSLDSQIIKQILPTRAPGPEEKVRRGEATEPFSTHERGGRVGQIPTLQPRARVTDYLFYALAALVTVALGGLAAVAVLHADSSVALEVHVVPATEATVIVDGLPRGRAPLRIEALPPGQHTVTLVAPGFQDAQRQVVIAPRESASIEIALTPLVPVVREAEGSIPAGVLPPGLPAPTLVEP